MSNSPCCRNRSRVLPHIVCSATIAVFAASMIAGCPADTSVLGTNSTVARLLQSGGVGPASPDGAQPVPLPTITPPADLEVECDVQQGAAQFTTWLNGATFTDGCGEATLMNDF